MRSLVSLLAVATLVGGCERASAPSPTVTPVSVVASWGPQPLGDAELRKLQEMPVESSSPWLAITSS